MTAVTEAVMLALLEARYGRDSGNGPMWAFVPHVRDGAGFDGTRTMDALAMSLWKSRGRELHGHEIKISRADWLRELRQPAKMEAFLPLVDRWWLVVADKSIVQDGELPPTWGLMVKQRGQLRVAVQAPLLPHEDGVEWMPRSFLAALLRAAVRKREAVPAEVEAARDQEAERYEQLLERAHAQRDAALAQIRAFEQASGVGLADWHGDQRPAAAGAALRAVLDGDSRAGEFRLRFTRLAEQAEHLSIELRRAAG